MDEDTPSWTLSDFSVDRDKERIDPAGWDLKAFKQNPVVLWSHDYMLPAIGKVLSPRVKDGQLKGKIQFSGKEVDPFGWMIGEKVKEGILSAGSVGYKSIKIEIVDDKDKKEPARLINRQQELYEFSILNIASNPNARVERMASEEYTKPDDYEGAKEFNERIENLEKALSRGNTYIGALMNVERETSGPKSQETSEMDKLFEKPEIKLTEDIFDG